MWPSHHRRPPSPSIALSCYTSPSPPCILITTNRFLISSSVIQHHHHHQQVLEIFLFFICPASGHLTIMRSWREVITFLSGQKNIFCILTTIKMILILRVLDSQQWAWPEKCPSMWVSRNEYYGQNVFFEIMIIMPVMLLVTMMKMLATKWILMRTNHFLIWTRGRGDSPLYRSSQ